MLMLLVTQQCATEGYAGAREGTGVAFSFPSQAGYVNPGAGM